MCGLMKSAMELAGRGVIREVGMINAVTVGATRERLCDDATVLRCLEEGREGGSLLIVEDVDLATWGSDENDGGGGGGRRRRGGKLAGAPGFDGAKTRYWGQGLHRGFLQVEIMPATQSREVRRRAGGVPSGSSRERTHRGEPLCWRGMCAA